MTGGLAVIVVNYGSHELLAQNLAGLAFDEIGARCVVVDNFTSQAEVSSLRALADSHGWEVVASPTNCGFGAGVNLGVARAAELGSDAYLLLNPDVQITADDIRALGAEVSSHPMDVVSPRILNSTGGVWFAGGELDVETGRVRTSREAEMDAPFSWLTGACLAVSKQVWQATGGFDPDYFLYWEDVDFSQRAKAVGARLVVRNDLVVTHDVGATQGTGKSAVYLRFNSRNRLLFASKWLPKRIQRRWIRQTPIQSYRVLVRGGRRSLLQGKKVWAVVAGSVSGASAVVGSGPTQATPSAIGVGSR